MKTKTIAIFLVVALLIVVLIRFTQQAPKVTMSNEKQDVPLEATNLTRAREVKSANMPANGMLDALPPGTNLQEQLEELARRKGISVEELKQQASTQWSNGVLEMSNQVNHNIEFYGKAIDQDGAPLESVNVQFGCVIFPDNYYSTNVLSDSAGAFGLSGVTGAILNVQVSKNGYTESTNEDRFVYYSPTGVGEFRPDFNSPVIFRLRKTE